MPPQPQGGKVYGRRAVRSPLLGGRIVSYVGDQGREKNVDNARMKSTPKADLVDILSRMSESCEDRSPTGTV